MPLLRILSALALLFLFSSCASPLWPRYKIEKQKYELAYSSTAPPRISFTASYRLQNTGDRPLASLDVALPNSAFYGLENLRLSLDSAAVSAPPAEKNLLRIPFSPAWPVRKKLSLTISYDLTARTHPQNELALLEDSFYLSTAPWYPILQPPDAHISSGGPFTDDYDVTVRVPEDFLVHAAGRHRGSKRQGTHRLHRFTISNNDFDPFIISGRYSEQRFTASGFPIIFWTRQPLPPDQLRAAATRLGQSVAVFESLFGPRYHPPSPIWIFETQLSHGRRGAMLSVFSSKNLPEAVGFYGSHLLVSEPQTQVFSDLVEEQVGATWLRHLTIPKGKTEEFLAWGIKNYAVRAAHSHGQRVLVDQTVRTLLDDYEQRERMERAALQTPENHATFETKSAESDVTMEDIAKARLMLFALELEIGPAHFRAALRRMIQARRGRDWSINDFRSALEAESGQSLADFFRLWLNEPCIPADFRARYSRP